MPDIPIKDLLNIFLAIGALFALWKGNGPERLGAGVVILNLAIGNIAHALLPGGHDVVRLFNDGLAAVGLLVITLRFGAPWMGGVMLFFAAQFAMHSFYLVTDRGKDYAYALINNLNWCGIVWCLIIGAAVAWRARVRARRTSAAEASA